jgi:transposase
MWCVAKLDEEYIARMEDVLGLYEKPLSAPEPVVCIDEKPVVLHEDTCTPIPMRSGRIARRDYEYKRCGTANVFCGVEPRAGRHFTKVTPTRCSVEFADYLLNIAARYPAADTIHLVMDNLSTHTQKALVERFGDTAGTWLWNRFTVHYTPKHGSWLNQAEMEISMFSRQRLGKRRIGDIPALRKQAQAWNRRVNKDKATIQWKFARRQARRRLHYTITRSKHCEFPARLRSMSVREGTRLPKGGQVPILHGQRLLILSGDASIETGADCFGSLLPLAKNLPGFPDAGPRFYGHFKTLPALGRRVSFPAMSDSS